jgi:hypothetical protein
VLEGPDGGGKTTLGQRLVERYGLVLYHSGGPTADAHDVRARMDLYLLKQAQWMWDRISPISERVYPEAVSDRRSWVDERELDRPLALTVPAVVYCRPPLDVVLRTPSAAKAHKPQEFTEQVIKRRSDVVELYDAVMSKLAAKGLIRLMFYDRTVDDTARMVFAALEDGGVLCAD